MVKTYDFSNNKIEFIPSQIQVLQYLRILSLKNNRLTYLPNELFLIANYSYSGGGSGAARLDVNGNLFDDKELNQIIKTVKDKLIHVSLIY
ncbi:unnamed protein product [Didymodactylos carnosus]|uniref:Uncharacterized protein n=1 Tax=Didymodactylos carnosus TaxID=1234261 RepID=A0A8S2EIJ1_9BILA|nr:unnamed protein product [Didymodactylos carnosus]CAF4043342.1 unnamed protein product [Didymodactylos carnosus]